MKEKGFLSVKMFPKVEIVLIWNIYFFIDLSSLMLI